MTLILNCLLRRRWGYGIGFGIGLKRGLRMGNRNGLLKLSRLGGGRRVGEGCQPGSEEGCLDLYFVIGELVMYILEGGELRCQSLPS